MKRYVIYASLGLLLALFTQCKKQNDPIQTTEASVFSFTGKIDGTQINLLSGLNNYFMYSSLATSTNNLKQFIGELKVRNCQGACKNSLKLILNDYRAGGFQTTADSSFQQRFYSYSSPAGTANVYSVTFIPQFFGGAPLSYTWTFENGSTSNLASPSRIYSLPGKYPVCVQIKSASACTSSLCGDIKIASTGNQVESNFAVSTATGNSLSFTAQPALGVAPYTYAWDFGDGSTSALANPSHTYSSNGVYLVSLTVTDSKNTSSTFQNNVNTQSPGNCMTKFQYNKIPIANSNNLANVILEWTDSNGIIYTSENNAQPAYSGFTITSVEEYNTNENGQKTKKIRALLNCTLYNGANSVVLDEAEIVFAVAYQ